MLHPEHGNDVFEFLVVRRWKVDSSANGLKVAWSIADYLATLEKSAGELLPGDAKPESKPDANSKSEARGEATSVPKPAPKPEPNGRPEPVASAPKADH